MTSQIRIVNVILMWPGKWKPTHEFGIPTIEVGLLTRRGQSTCLIMLSMMCIYAPYMSIKKKNSKFTPNIIYFYHFICIDWMKEKKLLVQLISAMLIYQKIWTINH